MVFDTPGFDTPCYLFFFFPHSLNSNCVLKVSTPKMLPRLALVILSVAGVAGQTCCTGTSNPSKGTFPATGGQCTGPPDNAYVWTLKTCETSTTCRSYKCTVSAVGITVDTLIYQGCFSDASYQTAMVASSINSYKCTSDASDVKSGLLGVWLASAILLSVFYSTHI